MSKKSKLYKFEMDMEINKCLDAIEWCITNATGWKTVKSRLKFFCPGQSLPMGLYDAICGNPPGYSLYMGNFLCVFYLHTKQDAMMFKMKWT